MIIDSVNLFKFAQEKHFAIPAANFIDLQSARTYVRTAEKRGLPLILAFAQSHRDYLSLEEAAVIGKAVAEQVSPPIVLHLDHGADSEYIKQAIKLGFSSVMIDASEKSFEDNIAITKEVVDYAHQHGVVVEAELGHVGANDTSEAKEAHASIYTEVEKVLEFVARTNVDSLAVSIGTAHGIYTGTPRINFERLAEITALTNVPLVLHGGSSSGDENLARCAREGISKINIYTDFLVGAMSEIQSANPSDYISLKAAADRGMERVLNHYFDVFGTQPISIGRGD